MKELTSNEYYASDQEYYLDNENVADCKLQHKIDAETTLYALHKDADQFMLSSMEGDVFYVDTDFATLLNFLKSE